MASIRIPVLNSQEVVEIYPDELPIGDGHNDLIDLLRLELAPLKVEYHRQGFHDEFSAVLSDIVTSLEDPSVQKIYKERSDYAESMTEIFDALAAQALGDLATIRSRGDVDRNKLSHEESECTKKFMDYLKKAEENMRTNEYTWLIKGFFELRQGETKRAEDNFRAVHDRATKGGGAIAKRRYQFGALIGLGIVAYAKSKFKESLDYFVKAAKSNVTGERHGPLRVAVAACCLQLKLLPRALAALEHSLELDPSNEHALVLLALVQQALAHTDPALRMQCRAASYEYCLLASTINPTNAMALNHTANHCFHSWRAFNSSSCCVLDNRQLAVSAHNARDLRVDDLLLVCSVGAVVPARWHVVTHVDQEQSSSEWQQLTGHSLEFCTVITVNEDLPAVGVCEVKVRELGRCRKLASDSLVNCSLPGLRAESYYILGKTYHLQGKIDQAFDFYKQAIKESSTMILAKFEAAKILLSRREFPSSLELFEKIKESCPEDKDTKAYILLLRTIMHKEVASLETLRSVAPGFQFESDLWLQQAVLRHLDPADYDNALRCYEYALERLPTDHSANSTRSKLLMNMSVLSHHNGHTHDALVSIQNSLLAFAKSDLPEAVATAPSRVRCAEFAGLLYDWRQAAVVRLQARADEQPHTGRQLVYCVDPDTADTVDLTEFVSAGDEVVIENLIHVVESVSRDSVATSCAVGWLVSSNSSTAVCLLRRVSRVNLDASVFCLLFNYARILEDLGRSVAATELYSLLVKLHPAHVDCYLRLSRICTLLGKHAKATEYLARAGEELGEARQDADIVNCLGDVHAMTGHWEDAKKCFEKIISKDRKDARAMLSLGNMYFSNLSTKFDSYIKESYKFYHHVLIKDTRNSCAANGLGMVCAEKGEMEAAITIFAKVRECDASVQDSTANLASANLVGGRLTEAHHHFLAAAKQLLAHGRGVAAPDQVMRIFDGLALCEFKSNHFEECLMSLLRSLHLDPGHVRAWYNVAVTRSSLAALIMRRHKSIEDIKNASIDMHTALQLFEVLSRHAHADMRQVDREAVQTKRRQCQESIGAADVRLQEAMQHDWRQREERRVMEEQHRTRREQEQQQRTRLTREAEAKRKEQQSTAALKMKQLSDMQEKWGAAAGSGSGSGAPARVSTAGAGSKPTRASQDGGGYDSDSDASNGNDQVPQTRQPITGEGEPTRDPVVLAKQLAMFGSDDEDDDEPSNLKRPIETDGLNTSKKVKLDVHDDQDA